MGYRSNTLALLFALCLVALQGASQAHMIIRGNSTLTDSIPDSGDTLNLKWPDADTLVGTAIRYIAADGSFVFDSAGRYHVQYTEKLTTSSTNTAYPVEPKIGIWHSGHQYFYGRKTHWISKQTSSNSAQITNAALIDAAIGDTVRIIVERVDAVVQNGEKPVRAAEESSVVIFKFPNHWEWASYFKTSAQAIGTGINAINYITLDSTAQEGTPFTLEANGYDVTSGTANHILAYFSMSANGTGATADYNIQTRNRFAGNTNTYRPWLDNKYSSSSVQKLSFGASGIWPASVSETFAMQTVNRNATYGSTNINTYELQMIELPSTSEVFHVRGGSNPQNGLDQDFLWTQVFEIDALTYDQPNDTLITIEKAGTYLFFGGSQIGGSGGAAYTIPRHQITIDNTVDTRFGSSDFIRGGSTLDHMTTQFSAIVPGITVGTELRYQANRLGASGGGNSNGDVFQGINLTTILGSPAAPSSALGINGVDASTVNGVNYSSFIGISK